MNVENLLEGSVEAIEGAVVSIAAGGERLRGPWTGRERPSRGQQACMAIRAERLKLGQPPAGGGDGCNLIACRPGATIYKGKYLDQTLETTLGPIKARVWDRDVALDTLTSLWWRPGDCAVTSAGEDRKSVV